MLHKAPPPSCRWCLVCSLQTVGAPLNTCRCKFARCCPWLFITNEMRPYATRKLEHHWSVLALTNVVLWSFRISHGSSILTFGKSSKMLLMWLKAPKARKWASGSSFPLYFVYLYLCMQGEKRLQEPQQSKKNLKQLKISDTFSLMSINNLFCTEIFLTNELIK